jgi:prolyl 4-hydroxylase
MTVSWNPVLDQWLEENLGRQVPLDLIRNSMLENGMDPEAADAILQQKVFQLNPAFPSPRLTSAQHVYSPIMMMKNPTIVVYENFMSPTECEQLITMSHGKLAESLTVSNDTGESEKHAARTSRGCYFMADENPFIAKLDARIADLMDCPQSHGEGLQILNYGIGGEYKPHFDYFPDTEGVREKHMATGGQRVATLIMYLNTPEEGGETIFPEITLSIKARQGHAVYFSYCNTNGQLDPKTLHGGCPVTKGEKWIVTKWMRQFSYQTY